MRILNGLVITFAYDATLTPKKQVI